MVWGSDSEHCLKHLQLYLPGMAPTLPIWNGSQLAPSEFGIEEHFRRENLTSFLVE